MNYSKEFLELQGKMDKWKWKTNECIDLFVFQQQKLSSKIESSPTTHTNEDGSVENYLKYSLNLETENISDTSDNSINVSVVNMLFILTPVTTVIDQKLTNHSQAMIDETANRLLSARAEMELNKKRIQLEIENLRSGSSDLELAKSRILMQTLPGVIVNTIKEKWLWKQVHPCSLANKLQTETVLQLMT